MYTYRLHTCMHVSFYFDRLYQHIAPSACRGHLYSATSTSGCRGCIPPSRRFTHMVRRWCCATKLLRKGKQNRRQRCQATPSTKRKDKHLTEQIIVHLLLYDLVVSDHPTSRCRCFCGSEISPNSQGATMGELWPLQLPSGAKDTPMSQVQKIKVIQSITVVKVTLKNGRDWCSLPPGLQNVEIGALPFVIGKSLSNPCSSFLNPASPNSK